MTLAGEATTARWWPPCARLSTWACARIAPSRRSHALQHAAANDGVQEDALVHEALRRYLGLRGLAVLDDMARRQAGGVQLDEGEAMALAVSEVRAARAERRRAQGA